ncbi:hypothetical protein MPH_12474 [Macrophomina phaseolina MS6]|uniref:Uncharacterized protein n=1 Tax=Macrophomina phaseolina (strain MS6) TaxID=1126212 RepID=K2S0W4_MACPH|nr:hypothetical protein MPH_12474 [Macrophomina phaseolina MS6]
MRLPSRVDSSNCFLTYSCKVVKARHAVESDWKCMVLSLEEATRRYTSAQALFPARIRPRRCCEKLVGPEAARGSLAGNIFSSISFMILTHFPRLHYFPFRASRRGPLGVKRRSGQLAHMIPFIPASAFPNPAMQMPNCAPLLSLTTKKNKQVKLQRRLPSTPGRPTP